MKRYTFEVLLTSGNLFAVFTIWLKEQKFNESSHFKVQKSMTK